MGKLPPAVGLDSFWKKVGSIVVGGVTLSLVGAMASVIHHTPDKDTVSEMIQTQSPFAADRQTFIQHGKDIEALAEEHDNDYLAIDERLDEINETQAVQGQILKGHGEILLRLDSKLDRIEDKLPR